MASSKQFPMLKLRGQWYSYRKRVPAHLRGVFGGRREIVVSLHTQDEGEARVRVLRIAHETEKALQRAREQYRALVVSPDAMAKQWRLDALRIFPLLTSPTGSLHPPAPAATAGSSGRAPSRS